jgi:hypothetical protein
VLSGWALRRTQTGYRCGPARSTKAKGAQAPKASGAFSDVAAPADLKSKGSSPFATSIRVSSARTGPEFSNRINQLSRIELPGDLSHLFHAVGSHLVGAVLSVLGVAIGKGAILQADFWPTPINPGLGFALCTDQSEAIEGACQAITQSLRDEGDKKLSRMGEGAKDIQEQIRAVESERRAFFGADIVRDPAVDARFLAKIEGLRSLLHPTIVAEINRPGSLNLTVSRNGGAGLLACLNDTSFLREIDAATKDPRDLGILTQAWQGKTPELSCAAAHKTRPIVRPVVGVLITFTEETISRLVCSADPLVRVFAPQLILARAPHSGCSGGADLPPLPQFWPLRIEHFVALRDSGVRRQLRLSREAASLLRAYAKEVSKQESEQQRWLRKAPINAAKICIILHLWKDSESDEITEKTMRAAIELARWLAQESAATACACAAGAADREIRQEAAVMLQKLKKRIEHFQRPITRRELYQCYDNESRALHDPVLEFLLRAGQVRWVDGDRLEPTPETSGETK